MDPGFFVDPDPGLKSPDPDPHMYKCDLNDGFDKVLEEPDQKKGVKRARYEI